MNLRDFNDGGHWYTSYPSLNHWSEDFGAHQYADRLGAFCETRTPVHLYAHIPFCAKLCYYCICNIIVTNQREKIQHFLDHLLKEIDLLLPYRPLIREIQLGGGTPSHLYRDQFSALCEKLAGLVDLSSLDEFAMEIDPRTVTGEDLAHYATHGVTRISFGVQDFDPEVQKSINRVQPYEMVAKLMESRHLFKGVNFDLLYGLPLQTMATIRETLDKVRRLSPDRVTVLKYCHAPELRRHMRLIKASELVAQEQLREMFVEITDSLLGEGYEWIGLDHFAKRTDSLAIGASQKTVGRTFNGFTPGRVRDLIGIGPTSSGAFGDIYSQSHYDLKEYYSHIEKGEFPILRGYRLTEDDVKRRTVIFSLLCNQRATVDEGYFARELKVLREYPDLCTVEKGEVTVHERLFLRNICKVFDAKDVSPKHHRIAQKSMTVRAA